MFRKSSRAAFTIIELLIVVVCLAILAGLAIPYIEDDTMDARIASTQTTLRTIASAMDIYRMRFLAGQYPANILPEWFVGNGLPANPMSLTGETTGSVEAVNTVGALNPADIALNGSNKSFWYNQANGITRARVPSMDSDAATQSLYEIVNGIQLPIQPGGGGIGIGVEDPVLADPGIHLQNPGHGGLGQVGS